MSAPIILALCGGAYIAIAIAIYTFPILLAKSRGVCISLSNAGRMDKSNPNSNFVSIDIDVNTEGKTPSITTTTASPISSTLTHRLDNNNNKAGRSSAQVTVSPEKLRCVTTRAARRLRRTGHGPAIVQVPTGGYNCAVM
jgi:hypothetical protein